MEEEGEENTSSLLNLIFEKESVDEDSEDDDNNPYEKAYIKRRNNYQPLQGRSLSAQFEHLSEQQ